MNREFFFFLFPIRIFLVIGPLLTQNPPPPCRPKLSKHPDGYPGDTEETYPLARRELREIRTHVRWTCHSCRTVFKDLEKTCRSCGHARCGDCPREPPESEKEPVDESVVESVAEKMRRIEISPQASAA